MSDTIAVSEPVLAKVFDVRQGLDYITPKTYRTVLQDNIADIERLLKELKKLENKK